MGAVLGVYRFESGTKVIDIIATTTVEQSIAYVTPNIEKHMLDRIIFYKRMNPSEARCIRALDLQGFGGIFTRFAMEMP